MAGRQKLRILCFGDSLTAGYTQMGSVYHPYEETLQQMLEMAFPDVDIETVEDGKPGDTVKHGFLPRILKNFPFKKQDDESYDWTIVLGGTNDLAYNIKPEDIFEKLKQVWEVPLRRKSKVLALTVPEAGVFREQLNTRRTTLNDLIKGYKREGFHVFDLHTAVPFFAMSTKDQERYWDDNVHFTSDGYDLIGNKVGISLVSILAKEKANAPPAKKRRVFRDDDKSFEEEVGDPTAIDQGYIVVRRKDLD
ncbi:SGNH hydrolase-type esterase domain-containing protein [Lasiosphaeris hirsuta]|uniref:SGNH hydrolase-type esterase domain-containing protein n=1 Tax=Lasiosphaeris hirsuta TaxID=260670 RepID=A0AA40BAW6_9PEZI|nr:SGNH hydrolase-type esterase domain-containing protein [Lasiosphaeris hirsuta]